MVTIEDLIIIDGIIYHLLKIFNYSNRDQKNYTIEVRKLWILISTTLQCDTGNQLNLDLKWLIFTQNSIENITAFLKIKSDNSYLQFIEQNLIHERQ